MKISFPTILCNVFKRREIVCVHQSKKRDITTAVCNIWEPETIKFLEFVFLSISYRWFCSDSENCLFQLYNFNLFNSLRRTFYTIGVQKTSVSRRPLKSQNKDVTEENWNLCKKDYIWLLSFLSEFCSICRIIFFSSNIFFSQNLKKNS